MFAIELALETGHVNVRRMLRSIPAKDFADLFAYRQIYPGRERRADLRAAQITQMLYNMNVKREHVKPLKDFLLDFDDKPEEKKPKQQTWQDQKAIFMQMAMAMGYQPPPE